ncbi:hypothetical protein Dimus_014375 [Dionaea muscipula]
MKSKSAADDCADHHWPNKRPCFNENEIIVSTEETSGLRLLGILLQCAECVAVNNLADATDLILEASELSSPFGSPPDRVAAYFADALRARIFSSFTSIHSPLTNFKSLNLSHSQGFHAAFQSYNAIAPLVKFSHFTANQAIFEALDGHDRVHVIDFDIMQGLQWPGLFQILASRPRKVLSVRVTGIGSSVDLLDQTGQRLAEFARSLGLPFEFNTVEGRIGEIRDLSRLGLMAGEARVVHWTQHGLYDVTGSDLGTLTALTLIKPRLVTVIEQDLSKTGSFLGRFVEALHYYSALFDALEAGGEGDSVRRHQVEQRLFGWEIRNILAVGGVKRGVDGGGIEGVRVVERWGEELMKVGFRQFSLAGGAAAQAGLLLGMAPWRGYSLVEENGWLKLGWKDLSLLTASAWQCQPADADDDDLQ